MEDSKIFVGTGSVRKRQTFSYRKAVEGNLNSLEVAIQSDWLVATQSLQYEKQVYDKLYLAAIRSARSVRLGSEEKLRTLAHRRQQVRLMLQLEELRRSASSHRRQFQASNRSLLALEHFPRARRAPSTLKLTQTASGSKSNSWDGTEYKYTLLKSLYTQLQKKAVILALDIYRQQQMTTRRMCTNVPQLHRNKLLLICFQAIITEGLGAIRTKVSSRIKADKYLLNQQLQPTMRRLAQYARDKHFQRRLLYAAILYDERRRQADCLPVFLQLLRRRRVRQWAQRSYLLLHQQRAFLAWLYAYKSQCHFRNQMFVKYASFSDSVSSGMLMGRSHSSNKSPIVGAANQSHQRFHNNSNRSNIHGLSISTSHLMNDSMALLDLTQQSLQTFSDEDSQRFSQLQQPISAQRCRDLLHQSSMSRLQQFTSSIALATDTQTPRNDHRDETRWSDTGSEDSLNEVKVEGEVEGEGVSVHSGSHNRSMYLRQVFQDALHGSIHSPQQQQQSAATVTLSHSLATPRSNRLQINFHASARNATGTNVSYDASIGHSHRSKDHRSSDTIEHEAYSFRSNRTSTSPHRVQSAMSSPTASTAAASGYMRFFEQRRHAPQQQPSDTQSRQRSQLPSETSSLFADSIDRSHSHHHTPTHSHTSNRSHRRTSTSSTPSSHSTASNGSGRRSVSRSMNGLDNSFLTRVLDLTNDEMCRFGALSLPSPLPVVGATGLTGTKDSPQDDGLPLGVAADDEDDRYYLTFPPAQREQLLLFQRTRQTRRWIQSALRFLRRLQRRTRLHTAYTRTHSLIYLRRQFLGHSWTRWRHAYARWQHLTGLCDTIYATKLRDKVWYTWSNSSITRQSLWTTLSTHVVHRRHRRTLRSHWRCWLVLYRARQEQLQVETFRKRRVLFTVCREWRAVTVRQQRERRCVRYWQWRHWVQPRFQTWRQKFLQRRLLQRVFTIHEQAWQCRIYAEAPLVVSTTKVRASALLSSVSTATLRMANSASAYSDALGRNFHLLHRLFAAWSHYVQTRRRPVQRRASSSSHSASRLTAVGKDEMYEEEEEELQRAFCFRGATLLARHFIAWRYYQQHEHQQRKQTRRRTKEKEKERVAVSSSKELAHNSATSSAKVSAKTTVSKRSKASGGRTTTRTTDSCTAIDIDTDLPQGSVETKDEENKDADEGGGRRIDIFQAPTHLDELQQELSAKASDSRPLVDISVHGTDTEPVNTGVSIDITPATHTLTSSSASSSHTSSPTVSLSSAASDVSFSSATASALDVQVHEVIVRRGKEELHGAREGKEGRVLTSLATEDEKKEVAKEEMTVVVREGVQEGVVEDEEMEAKEEELEEKVKWFRRQRRQRMRQQQKALGLIHYQPRVQLVPFDFEADRRQRRTPPDVQSHLQRLQSQASQRIDRNQRRQQAFVDRVKQRAAAAVGTSHGVYSCIDLDDLDEDADSRTQDTGEDDDAESLDSLGHIPRPYRDRARYERDRSRRRELYCDTDPVYTSSLHLVAAARPRQPHPQDSRRRRHLTNDHSAFVRKAPRTIVELAIACGYLAPPPATSAASSSASMMQYLLQRPLVAYIDPVHRHQLQSHSQNAPNSATNTTNTVDSHGNTTTTVLGVNSVQQAVGVGAHARWSQAAQRTLHYLAHLLRELLAHWRSYCAERAQERSAAVRVRQRARTWLLQATWGKWLGTTPCLAARRSVWLVRRGGSSSGVAPELSAHPHDMVAGDSVPLMLQIDRDRLRALHSTSIASDPHSRMGVVSSDPEDSTSSCASSVVDHEDDEHSHGSHEQRCTDPDHPHRIQRPQTKHRHRSQHNTKHHPPPHHPPHHHALEDTGRLHRAIQDESWPYYILKDRSASTNGGGGDAGTANGEFISRLRERKRVQYLAYNPPSMAHRHNNDKYLASHVRDHQPVQIPTMQLYRNATPNTNASNSPGGSRVGSRAGSARNLLAANVVSVLTIKSPSTSQGTTLVSPPTTDQIASSASEGGGVKVSATATAAGAKAVATVPSHATSTAPSATDASAVASHVDASVLVPPPSKSAINTTSTASASSSTATPAPPLPRSALTSSFNGHKEHKTKTSTESAPTKTLKHKRSVRIAPFVTYADSQQQTHLQTQAQQEDQRASRMATTIAEAAEATHHHHRHQVGGEGARKKGIYAFAHHSESTWYLPQLRLHQSPGIRAGVKGEGEGEGEGGDRGNRIASGSEFH